MKIIIINYIMRFLRYYVWISENAKNDLIQNDFIAYQSSIV